VSVEQWRDVNAALAALVLAAALWDLHKRHPHLARGAVLLRLALLGFLFGVVIRAFVLDEAAVVISLSCVLWAGIGLWLARHDERSGR
jgi:hypothetical protein